MPTYIYSHAELVERLECAQKEAAHYKAKCADLENVANKETHYIQSLECKVRELSENQRRLSDCVVRQDPAYNHLFDEYTGLPL